VTAARTLYDRIWQSHVVEDRGDGFALLYMDAHLLDEHTSAQAFDGLRAKGLGVRKPATTLAVVDHCAPTRDRAAGMADAGARQLIEAMANNAAQFSVPHFGLSDPRQGISHVVGPEQGLALPGMTIACGDSHVSTHGALGALSFGIGTTEIEHVLASQTLLARQARTMRIDIAGALARGVSAKDLILALIGRFGTAGATGHAVEFSGPLVRALSMEGRLTLANMSVELGAPAALIAPDETTFAWLKGRPYAPREAMWDKAIAYWRTLRSDDGAAFDRDISFDATGLAPQVTWGTSPQDVVDVTANVPNPEDERDPLRRRAMQRSLDYMGLRAGVPVIGTPIDKVFIGSCTNGRIEDLRAAAAIARGRRVAGAVQALVVPGSGLVKQQAEREGLDRMFREAGFEWREPGCSMCLAMNEDRLQPGERSASTSNRNFEGRQGAGGRTHLLSPAMAAAAAVTGTIVDVREYA
jgi:3-isopropylmalate/(R)-2-methylmalate dehydratase large subunit